MRAVPVLRELKVRHKHAQVLPPSQQQQRKRKEFTMIILTCCRLTAVVPPFRFCSELRTHHSTQRMFFWKRMGSSERPYTSRRVKAMPRYVASAPTMMPS